MTPNNFDLITPPDYDAVVVIDTDTPEGTTGTPKSESLPIFRPKQQRADRWEYSGENTRNYVDCLNTADRSGITFHGRVILVIGSGAGSIGGMVLEGLLEGGATVIAATSSFSQKVTEYYRAIYSTDDALPRKDQTWTVSSPFVAISEGDNEINNFDSKSELVHRMMLRNLVRLLGKIKK
ncbi:hypothetical protein ABVK25_010038 [Lepraria finkii]|uniref:Uncharacterized protein n=1 Tax=Lepraria finkii TaxID=1340010 RepID=A0ABR4AXP5_9LECA